MTGECGNLMDVPAGASQVRQAEIPESVGSDEWLTSIYGQAEHHL